ncbi:MAG: tRNA (adenosine(37)-N6)-dimethylallyltransferase MiaA [Bacteroidales bacterium]
MIVILGPTACGKTHFATQWALEHQGEIISADSRQVYKGMDIGTGKDLQEYTLEGVSIPYHLIDILAAGKRYNVFRFQQDFDQALAQILERGKLPILCGGTGLYIEAALSPYYLQEVPPNEALRKKYAQAPLTELIAQLAALRPLHNTSDTTDPERCLRAIEIALYTQEHAPVPRSIPPYKIYGLQVSREVLRERIALRLHQRLEQGMVAEVQALLNAGISSDDLVYYGLEYKYITQYLLGQISYPCMVSSLQTAICQFAKRQCTWFRRMEKQGFKIEWIQKD